MCPARWILTCDICGAEAHNFSLCVTHLYYDGKNTTTFTVEPAATGQKLVLCPIHIEGLRQAADDWLQHLIAKETGELMSPCCDAEISGSRGDGIWIGSCSKCNRSVIRINPRTGVEEWLDGEPPWTNKTCLRPVER